jgi:hypothetical protein
MLLKESIAEYREAAASRIEAEERDDVGADLRMRTAKI